MAQLTLGQMRALTQRLVADTNPAASGLSISDYTAILNDSMMAYADMFPDSLALSGIIASVAFAANLKSATLALGTTPPTSRNVTGCFLRTTGPLSRAGSPLDILRLQVSDATTATPQQYSLESLLPGQPTGNNYIMRLHPVPDAAYTVDVYGTTQPTPMLVDSDYTVFQDAECRIIARMAAVDAARLLGRGQDFVQQVASVLPDRVRAHMGVMVRDAGPRYAEGKSVA